MAPDVCMLDDADDAMVSSRWGPPPWLHTHGSGHRTGVIAPRADKLLCVGWPSMPYLMAMEVHMQRMLQARH